MNINNEKLHKYLKDILTLPSPTGYTYKVIDYIIKELDSLGITYKKTNKGALIATIQGHDLDNAITFSAHVDTLGAMVKNINSSGTLAITPLGGYMMNSIEGENCTIETVEGETFTGTIQTVKPSVHISGNDARELKRIPENMEVVIDEKIFSKEDTEKLGISIGDFICFDSRTIITKSGFVKSRHLDDKASIAILLYSMYHLKSNNIIPQRTINFFISNYEEVGHGSSAAIPENTKEFIAVDMGCPGPNQNSTEYDCCICAKDSSGPYDLDLRKTLVNICKENNISYKLDIYPYYGSDASAALRAGWDIRTALIGPGVFASHGYERTHMDSIHATLQLIIEYSQQ
ncbi:M42 family metallopeptidase [Oceanirhabdus sp. W0125-5]|uniref:M42 family metallopeptidase n=1 Tax=Oceanirhabdus sp. W0125-5 TaxID=2999116 RepID=UPI0022F33CC9|nr:M42 family metallopeptidase [Oceanirhabdus sp. W0125-5]WBW98792.1 M42 family metallopeptidase [Oceanirhabdus sp. W0125-5]